MRVGQARGRASVSLVEEIARTSLCHLNDMCIHAPYIYIYGYTFALRYRGKESLFLFSFFFFGDTVEERY